MKRIVVLSSLFILALFTVQCEKEEYTEVLETEVLGGAQFNPEPYDLNLPSRFPAMTAQNLQLTKAGVELGRHLFYDPILSGDSTQSCASCHNQSLGFTDNGKRFSTGIQGIEGTKNAMALINLGWRSSFFWDGRSPSLVAQALEPVKDPIEMHDTWPNAVNKLKQVEDYRNMFYAAFGTFDFDSMQVAEAIAQFELTLISGNSKFDKYLRGEILLTAEEELGMNIFNAEPRQKSNDPPGADCFHCHNVSSNGPMTSIDFFNNGLDANPAPGLFNVTQNQADWGKFKVPTLRNVAVTAPYMHDGRFKTLEEVIEHYSSGVQSSPTLDPIMTKAGGLATGELLLTDAEKKALVAFLHTLTDDEFLTNPAFQNPHSN